ncbi:MAG: DUF4129 domain-containing protein [Clostridiales bacterium]|jgi:hypothetical protein|nr:DUF4129 domain-containing protein [Clostridiales bacterium]
MFFDEAVAQVLARRKYDALMGRSADIIQALRAFAENLLRQLNLSAPPSVRNNMGHLTAIFLIVFTALVLAIAVAAVVITRKRKRSGTLTEMFEELGKYATYTEILAQSDVLAASGRLREAVRFRYIALLWAFGASRVLRVGDAKTNSQLKREVRKAAPELSEVFGQIADIFDFVWFGNKSCPLEKYHYCASAVDGMINELAARQGGAA